MCCSFWGVRLLPGAPEGDGGDRVLQHKYMVYQKIVECLFNHPACHDFVVEYLTSCGHWTGLINLPSHSIFMADALILKSAILPILFLLTLAIINAVILS